LRGVEEAKMKRAATLEARRRSRRGWGEQNTATRAGRRETKDEQRRGCRARSGASW